ncbi:MAG: DUF6134 family protein [Pseudomonadota bacterium]
MRRRDFIAGGATSVALSGISAAALADGGASRVFRILRDGSDIGRHSLAARLGPKGFEIDIEVDIRVRILGITAYRYTLSNQEIWAGGQLVSVNSTVNDDGTAEYARIRSTGAALEIDGSGFSGTAPVEAVTTSYHQRAFVDRRPWISTQSGKPLDVALARGTAAGGERWQVTGELTTALIYDTGGEWVGCEFDAGGEPGRYELVEQSGAIAPLWAAA